jgi:cyclophilin family peptidyl-prolyl cis-trans isomerase
VIEVEGSGQRHGRDRAAARCRAAACRAHRTLARDGAYDGVAFHRVIDGFMAQTGDVEFGTQRRVRLGAGGHGRLRPADLPAEFSDVSFDARRASAWRGAEPDSANSQFFIMFAPATHLDGQYTVVGRVISGRRSSTRSAAVRGRTGMVASRTAWRGCGSRATCEAARLRASATRGGKRKTSAARGLTRRLPRRGRGWKHGGRAAASATCLPGSTMSSTRSPTRTSTRPSAR